MKTSNTNFLETMGKTALNNLVQEVKETVAVNTVTINQKTAFGTVDLWNLERNRRTRMIRRHLV